ncbi:MAG: hypothetical protein WEC83_01250 [Patescibacteria group bacterium]
MSARQALSLFVASFFGLLIVAQPLFVVGQWRFDRVQAQEGLSEISPEDQFTDASPIDSLSELDPVLLTSPALSIAPQDVNAIREGRVDVRVTDYLIYLITPVEQGGAGFKHIKAQRILKNYDTDGTGKFDRETLAAIEEDGSVVSAHNTGQAVDISEVGAITCKLVERRYLGGSTTKWQRPKPIKVAWQSRDGIQRHPTPKGPSLFEIAGTMSAQSILMMLNESGEMDDFSDYVKGLTIGEIFQYVGANILLKNYGAGDILVDPLSSDPPDMLGALLLQRSLPGLPTNLPIADGDQDIREAIARAQLEELLNLPGGSVRGDGWWEILRNTGKRTLENGLGLPTLAFESRTLGQALDNGSVRAALTHFKDSDKALSLLPGTVALIQAKDDLAFAWAGVNLLADALRLSPEQRQRLTSAVQNSQTPNIKMSTTGADHGAPVDVLDALFEQTNANQKLRDFGQKYLSQVLPKAVPNQLLGLTKEVIGKLANSATTVAYGELRRAMGIRKIASDASSEPAKAQTALDKPASQPNQYHSQIADNLNNQFSLDATTPLTSEDIRQMFNNNPTPVFSKIGGNQADKAIGWNAGTGYAFINGDKALGQGLQEVFNNSISTIVGLPRGTNVSLEGDAYRNYGDALVATRLGFQLTEKGSATDINPQTLYAGFGLRESRSLADLRADEGYWQRPDVTNALEFSDIRLGVPLGTSAAYLRGDLNDDQLARRSAQSNLSTITQNQLLSQLDLGDDFKLSNDEIGFIITTIGDWDNTAFENRARVIDLGKRLIGRTLDQRSTFAKDAIISLTESTDTTGAAVKIMIEQGVRQLAGALGVNVASFEEKDYRILTRLITDAYNNELDSNPGAYGFDADNLLIKWTTDATGIPVEQDVRSFIIDGNVRTGLESWSAAQMVKFAGIYLPAEQQLTYQEMRNAINFGDQAAINLRADQIIAESGATSLTEEQLFDARNQARRELMQEARDESKYKISDAFLRQAEIPIPVNFSKVMFSGTNQERSEMLTSSIFAYLDNELIKINPNYTPGTLEALYDGDIGAGQLDQLVINIASGQSGPLAGFSTGFLGNFYSFISSSDKTAFFTDSRYDNMWGAMENWFGNNLGISGLPPGFAKSVYYASENGWDFNANITQNGQVIVPSINQIGSDLLANRVTQWADSTMGLPAGSAYQMYRAVDAVGAASRALAAARAVGDANQIAQAQQGLSTAQATLTVLAITIALNSCAACQQFFASVDQALAAPPGFTNALVAGAIAMAFGLGPAGLIAAAAIYLFGVYKVDYLCPLPPPDRFAYTQFDNPLDALEPSTNSYYADPATPIKDSPAPGQNRFDWDDGVPFHNGNSSELWMAWSRYFAGKLLDATMTYGAAQEGAGKPLQIITYRQANVEFFAPRAAATFGPSEAGNDRLGLGFTQASTKTTDWVHAAFGGFF